MTEMRYPEAAFTLTSPEARWRCRICGCQGDCRLFDGDECGWADKARTVCTSPACVKSWEREQEQSVQERDAARRAAIEPIRTRLMRMKSKRQSKQGRRAA